MKKILLSYLPPAISNLPSISLSILKSFLEKNGYGVRIKYWNISLEKTLLSNKAKNLPVKTLIPFFSILADIFRDERAKERIISELQSMNFFSKEYYIKFLNGKKKEIYRIIRSGLDQVDSREFILAGFSGKFYQWIPAIIFSQEFKKRFPGLKIVIGGFTNKYTALEIMKINKDFDFAIWGEGEYPLLELYECLLNKNKSFRQVPRLVFRDENNNITVSEVTKSDYLNFMEYIYPDYSDFLTSMPDKQKPLIWFPINSNRGCKWSRCKFCSQFYGYKYREREPECIAEEIESLYGKYHVPYFEFCDSTVIGKDIGKFNSLLDLLIKSSEKNKVKYHFRASVEPIHLSANIIKKMSIAGFRNIQIGFEALTDDLLERMDKAHRFADNILFLKFAKRYDITTSGSAMIKGFPDENETDVWKSINNLYFLRFFLDKSHNLFLFKLAIYRTSRYFSQIQKNKRQQWNYNPIRYLLPELLLSETDQYNLFGFFQSFIDNHIEWCKLEDVFKSLVNDQYDYKMFSQDEILHFEEFKNEKKIRRITFNEPVYYEILKIINDRVINIKTLYENLLLKNFNISEKKIKDIILYLKSEYIVYSNNNFSNIVSIVDTLSIYEPVVPGLN